ncbi:beta-propeller domain-containing protein [Bacillus sp. FJAT-49705]|uniref:Beta-propeller domain-containing protein n=1 Tax=Cytobacillus citreus TaxID=2833586 RepID=A0ABS5NQE2_9BACI|nr:beta-propeller domain-containing protein [Cytobacillus citreus]MBS4189638.1 beta-propeller domain-containing protein [Cytobacillus citreus]
MKNKWFVIIGVVSFFIIFLSFFFTTQLKVVSGMDEGDDKMIVLQNKVWKIHFSEKLKPASVNEKTVYVSNEKGEKQKVSLSLSNNQKTIMVEPPADGYSLLSQYYTLYVTKDIKSDLGRNMLKINKQTFTVKEKLPTADSKSKLNAHLLKRLKEEQRGIKSTVSIMDTAKEESSKSNDAGADFSETNVQVQGIDEGDVVKTDGSHIYQVVDGKVQIVKAVPSNQMSLESQIAFEQSFSPYQIFLHKDQLVIMGNSYGQMNMPMHNESSKIRIAPIHETTKVYIYNVKNKKSPKKVREIEIEGHLMSSRLMDGKVYLIANKYADIWLLKDNPEMDMRPKYFDSAKHTAIQPIDYNKIQYFPDSNESNFTNIAVIDLNNPKADISLSTYLGSGDNIYMSKDNLYLAVTNYYPYSTQNDPSFQLDTSVYKFTVKGMKVDFHSYSEVPGTVLNQFSMDEYKGYFRIATTKGQIWDDQRPSANNLYILDQNLKQVGELEDLARGERIYSARFMNDRIYIVTFKQTDPLFVIDGSNPQEPKVIGELKIPGFSNYLHPYDENHIIGFGHDTKVLSGKGERNQPIILTNGVKISLFDVSDMANPKEKFTEIIGGRGTYSPLNHDHKALLYDKKKNLFAFPITVYQNLENSQYDSSYEFQGVYVYNIDLNKGFTLKTKLSHQNPTAPYEEWENNIDRLLFIGNSLYTLSPQKISSYEIGSYKLQRELNLKK